MNSLNIDEIRGAVARGWTYPVNAKKQMDVDLALAISDEVQKLIAAWGRNITDLPSEHKTPARASTEKEQGS